MTARVGLLFICWWVWLPRLLVKHSWSCFRLLAGRRYCVLNRGRISVAS